MKGLIDLNDQEFLALMGELGEYLASEKVFVQDRARLAEVKRAAQIAKTLFSDTDVTIKDDPLQMGALILCINGFDITVKGQQEIQLFQDLISNADNFEVYPVGDERIKFAILFNHVLRRLP